MAEAVGALALAKGIELIPERLELYLKALADLELEPLLGAIETWIVHHKFFPEPCELRELVRPNMELAEAEVAWNQVVAYVERGYWSPDLGHHGFWGERKTPHLPPRTIYAMRQVGGFYRLWCHLEGDEEFKWLHKEFIEAWKLVPAEEQLAGSLEPKALLSEIQQKTGIRLLPDIDSTRKSLPSCTQPAQSLHSNLTLDERRILEAAQERINERRRGVPA